MPIDIASVLSPDPAPENAVPIVPVRADELDTVLAKDAAARRWAGTHDFSASTGQVLVVPGSDGAVARVLMGLGSNGKADAPDAWAFAGVVDQVPAATYVLQGVKDQHSLFHAGLGWALHQYRFDRYRQSNGKARCLHLAGLQDFEDLSDTVAACCLTRDLVNTPTNDMGPAQLEEAAQALAMAYDARLTSIVGDDLLAENFPAIHAVGRASSEAPRLIDLTWGEAQHPKLTLVGKGVCFDTGGLNLKTGNYMTLMKKDMGGAAHVLGLARWIMAQKLPVRLRLLIPAVENAVSGNAFRPSDIIATRKGISVEIGNTDAEGRLVLCDALALADEEQPDLMLDFATLTGAARVALGPDLPALFTDDHDLASAFATAAVKEGDPLWRLPLWMPYMEMLSSPVADTNNIGDGPFAGAIIAALYLKKFVEKTSRWAHFDVYAWNVANRAGRPKGGEAMALRATIRLLKERYKAKQ